MLESKEEVAARLVGVVANALHELYTRPQFPEMNWDESTPRRVAGPTITKASTLVYYMLTEYEATMKLNGYQVPSLLVTYDGESPDD